MTEQKYKEGVDYKLYRTPPIHTDSISVSAMGNIVLLSARSYLPDTFGEGKKTGFEIELNIPEIEPHTRLFMSTAAAKALLEDLQKVLDTHNG